MVPLFRLKCIFFLALRCQDHGDDLGTSARKPWQMSKLELIIVLLLAYYAMYNKLSIISTMCGVEDL